MNVVYFVILAEEKRDAPDTRKSNYYVDYSRKKSSRASRNPSNEVEGEKTDKTPVERADYRYNQRDFVYKHFLKPHQTFLDEGPQLFFS